MTGASGALYTVKLVRCLLEQGRPVHLVISDPARIVLREELDLSAVSLHQPEFLAELFGEAAQKLLTIHSNKDFSAPIASGSFPVEAMVVIPCSMGTLGAIASGVTQNLIHRAADCVLKESGRLVLVPRETPLNAIHLENMLKLSRLGVRMVPAMPGFYSGAKSIDDLVDFLVGKVLDQLEIQHALYPRWTGPNKKAAAHES